MTLKIEIGSIIAESYRVQAELGSGGYGVVFLAEEFLLNRQVAIKLLHLSTAESSALHRFQREAKALSQLRHVNIVNVFRFGSLPDGSPYLVMEYLEGESLHGLIARKGTLACHEALDIAVQVCTALEYAHANQVVHRDLKPANIVVCQTQGKPTVKVLDFGLCKDLSAGAEMGGTTLTITGSLLGTVQYMSPEQCYGQATDGRTDIYSFGCTLYEMLTGGPPFVGSAPAPIMLNHINDPVPKILDLAPSCGLPEELDALISKCMAKNKDRRYQSFKEVLEDLSSIQALNSQARFQSSESGSHAASLPFMAGRISAKAIKAIAITLAILFCCTVLALAFTDLGNAVLASQLQSSLPAESSLGALRSLFNALLNCKRISGAELVIIQTSNSKSFRSWSALDREQLLKEYLEAYKKAGRKQEAFDLSLRLLAEIMDSAFKAPDGRSPDPQELNDLAEVAKSLLATDKADKKKWAKIDAEIERNFLPFKQQRDKIMHWASDTTYDYPKENPFKAAQKNCGFLWLGYLRAEAMWAKNKGMAPETETDHPFKSFGQECIQTAMIAKECNEPQIEQRCLSMAEDCLSACEMKYPNRTNFIIRTRIYLGSMLDMEGTLARALKENQRAAAQTSSSVSAAIWHLQAGLRMTDEFYRTGHASKAVQTFKTFINDYERPKATEQDGQQESLDYVKAVHIILSQLLSDHPELKDAKTQALLESLKTQMKG